MGGQKEGRRTVKNLVKEFKADRVKNANVIVDIMERIESNESGTTLSAVTGLHHIFTYLLHEHAIERQIKAQGEDSARNKVNKWLKEMFEDTLKIFLNLLQHKERSVQELSLSSLVKLMQSEGRHPIRKVSSGYGFPLRRLKAVISMLISDTRDNRHLINLLSEYMEYQDFLYYTLLAVGDVVKEHKEKEESVCVTYMNNLMPVLEMIKISPPPPTTTTTTRPLPLLPPKLFLHPENEAGGYDDGSAPPVFSLPYPEAKHSLNTVWVAVMRYPLTPDLYRRVLIALPDLAMPHLDKPLALTGFFMESYNLGGAISLLALQGVFILINKHHLDYPDFYTKLYALLEPTIFNVKYKARFFMLCDRFLSSTHLPEYIISSFIKRLSRLSLHAPSSSLPLLIKFIQNLLIRFPGLQKLIHNPSVQDITEDPFKPEEPNPAHTRAGESSLWEVATLHYHALPSVAKLAAFTSRVLPREECNLGDWVEQGYEELFERSSKVKVKEGIALTFSKPQGLFHYPEQTMMETWAM